MAQESVDGAPRSSPKLDEHQLRSQRRSRVTKPENGFDILIPVDLHRCSFVTCWAWPGIRGIRGIRSSLIIYREGILQEQIIL
jgi:hypothetical protein